METSKLNKWVITSVAMLLVTVAFYDYIIAMVSKDSTYITVGIIVIFLMAHFAVAKLSVSEDKQLSARLWYTAEALIAAGMMGTVVGFIMLFGEAFAAIDVNDPETIANVLTDMASGMGTALVTTLMGLVSSFMLKGELVFIIGED